MMTEIRLSDTQLAQLAQAIAEKSTHPCRFSEDEAKAMHRFAQTIANGGWDKFSAVLAFGDALITARKAGTVALVGAFISGLLALLWLGLRHKMGGAA